MKLSIKADGTIEFDGNDMSGIDPVKIAEIVNAMKGLHQVKQSHRETTSTRGSKTKGNRYVRYCDENVLYIENDKNIPTKRGDFEHLLFSELFFISPDTGRSDLTDNHVYVKIAKAIVRVLLDCENTPMRQRDLYKKVSKNHPEIKETSFSPNLSNIAAMGILSKTGERQSEYFLSSKFVNQ